MMPVVASVVCAVAVALLTSVAATAEGPLPREAPAAERLLWGAKPGTSIGSIPLCGKTEAEVRSLLQAMGPLVAIDPISASVDRFTGKIIPEREGLALDIEATCRRIMSAGEGERIAQALIPVAPAIRAADIRGLKRPVGSYSTAITGSADRRENIRLSARYLDYTLLAAGETFSFLETLGPTSYDRGFVDAPVIVGEEFVPGPGGGVCQVATTIYNAAIESGLAIVERHRHTKPVAYVPEGMDAVVASWGLDLKVRNSLGQVIMLRVTASDGVLKARFLGP